MYSYFYKTQLDEEFYKKLLFPRLLNHILYGTDIPIMLWHGRREWDEKGYRNLCREDFS